MYTFSCLTPKSTSKPVSLSPLRTRRLCHVQCRVSLDCPLRPTPHYSPSQQGPETTQQPHYADEKMEVYCIK